jgi:hypothetical protein
MNRAAKYGISGIISIVSGFVLNELAKWVYYQAILASYSGTVPPPICPIAFTGFIALVPLGVVLLMYSGYIIYSEYEIVKKRESGSG